MVPKTAGNVWEIELELSQRSWTARVACYASRPRFPHPSPGGEIGRHRGLKIPRPLRSCRFKSGPGHHTNINKNIYLYVLRGPALAGLAEGQSDQQTSVELPSDVDALDTQGCADTEEANPFEISFEGEE